jgi:hypothetical protein
MKNKAKQLGIAGLCLASVMAIPGCVMTSTGQYAEDVATEFIGLKESNRQKRERMRKGVTINKNGASIHLYPGMPVSYNHRQWIICGVNVKYVNLAPIKSWEYKPGMRGMYNFPIEDLDMFK